MVSAELPRQATAEARRGGVARAVAVCSRELGKKRRRLAQSQHAATTCFLSIYRRLLLASLSLSLSLFDSFFIYLFFPFFSFVWWCPSHLWVHSLSPVYTTQNPQDSWKSESRSVGDWRSAGSADWATRQVLSKMMDGRDGCCCCCWKPMRW